MYMYISRFGHKKWIMNTQEINEIPTIQHKLQFGYRVIGYEMNVILGHDSAIVRLHWAGDNLG